MALGSFLKESRQNIKMSQNELSALSGISEQQIILIETGKTQKPRKDTLEKLSKALQVDYGKLLQLAGYPPRVVNAGPVDLKPTNYLKDKLSVSLESIAADIEDIKKKLSSKEVDVFALPGVQQVKPSKKYVPFYNTANCGSPAMLALDSGEMINAPEREEIDFAFKAIGTSMEGYRIFDGDIIFAKKIPECLAGQVVVIFVQENGEGHLLVKKCKEYSGIKTYVDSKGNEFKPDEKAQVVGVVTLVQGKPG